MGGGCTDCGRKGGCDGRKSEMFAAIDEALGRLYPGRRWSERAESVEAQGGLDPALGAVLAERLAARLSAFALRVPGSGEECCDYVYVLCLGRRPSLIEAREGLVTPAECQQGEQAIEELYLRVALSTVVPFAAVQQLTMRGEVVDGALLIEEAPRAGVFDPVLLPRLQKLVAVLAEVGIRHLDFGEIAEPPPGFDPGDYGALYGGEPALANYLFFPQPCSSITTTVVAFR